MVAVFSVAALLTPPDLTTQWMLGFPFLAGCELCFQAVRISENRANPSTFSDSISKRDVRRLRSRLVLALFTLMVLGLVFIDGCPDLGMAEVIFIVLIPFLLESATVLFAAFKSSMLKGLLCLLVPFYAPFFVFREGSDFFRGRWFAKVWACFACLATLYGILQIAGFL